MLVGMTFCISGIVHTPTANVSTDGCEALSAFDLHGIHYFHSTFILHEKSDVRFAISVENDSK